MTDAIPDRAVEKDKDGMDKFRRVRGQDTTKPISAAEALARLVDAMVYASRNRVGRTMNEEDALRVAIRALANETHGKADMSLLSISEGRRVVHEWVLKTQRDVQQ